MYEDTGFDTSQFPLQNRKVFEDLIEKGIRVFNLEVDNDNELFFVARDVAKILGYSNTHRPISSYCEEATTIQALSEEFEFEDEHLDPNLVLIKESDVHRLILASTKPESERYRNLLNGIEDVDEKPEFPNKEENEKEKIESTVQEFSEVLNKDEVLTIQELSSSLKEQNEINLYLLRKVEELERKMGHETTQEKEMSEQEFLEYCTENNIPVLRAWAKKT